MAVSREDVLHVARLARLRLGSEEVQRLTAELNGILAHVDALSGVPVEGAPPVGGVAEGGAPLRADEGPPDALECEPARLAVSWEDGFFTVPRLAALDADAPAGGETGA